MFVKCIKTRIYLMTLVISTINYKNLHIIFLLDEIRISLNRENKPARDGKWKKLPCSRFL
jgi:hypothetical protein